MEIRSLMTNVAKKQRLLSFDLMKLFAIFFVIWGHCILWFLSSDSSENVISRVLNSFHVSLFMMISGFFSASSMQLKMFDFFCKKIRQLLYPCYIWALLYFLCLFFINFGDLTKNLTYDKVIVDLYWYSNFWFLKSCFVCYFLLYVGIHLRLSKRYLYILSLLVSQLIPPFFVSFMFPCFLIGYELKVNISLRLVVRNHTASLLGTFLLLLLFWNKSSWDNSHGISFASITTIQDVLVIVFYRFYRLMIGIIGALSFFSIALSVSNDRLNLKPIPIIGYWGAYTLEIYILQSVILERFMSHFLKFDNFDVSLFNYFVSPLFSILILLACIIIIKLLSRSHTMMLFLFGRSVHN